MKYDALKHQGKTSGPLDPKLRTSEIIGNEVGESEKNIRRNIRLTYLTPELLQYVDNSELKESPSIALRTAVELSYLSKDEQEDLIDYNLSTPSLAQAIKLKKLSQECNLTSDTIKSILDEEKPNQKQMIKLSEEKLKKVLPKNIYGNEIEEYIIKAIEYYKKYRNREMER